MEADDGNISAIRTGLESLTEAQYKNFRIWNLDKEVIAKIKEQNCVEEKIL